MALADGGDEVHVISYALPSRLSLLDPRLSFHEVVVPHYPLFEYPPYSLALATKMVEVARHQQLDVLHVHYAVPNAVSAVLARADPGAAAAAGGDHAPRHRHHPGRQRPELPRDHALVDRPERRGDRGLRSLRRATIDSARHPAPDRGGAQLHRSRRATSAARGQPGARRWAKPGRARAGPHLQLPAGQAGARRGRGLPARLRARCRLRLLLVGDGPDRGQGRAALPRVRPLRRHRLHRQPAAGRGGAGRAPTLPAAVGDRVVRPRRARGAGLRGAGDRHRGRRRCRRWCATARTASSCRWATSTAWPRPRCACSRDDDAAPALRRAGRRRAVEDFAQDERGGALPRRSTSACSPVERRR